MTECFITTILKLSASGHAGFGNLKYVVNLSQDSRKVALLDRNNIVETISCRSSGALRPEVINQCAQAMR